MNADIAYITAHPGRYALSMRLHEVGAGYYMVEVEPNGTIHQLNPRGERDGVLSAEGFHPATRAYVVSNSELTFVRVPV